jgi:hypothetical protein
MKRKNPASGRACGIAGLGMFANSEYCEVCRIPTIETPCSTCRAWCDLGRHIQSAARALKSVQPKPTLKKIGRNHEQ